MYHGTLRQRKISGAKRSKTHFEILSASEKPGGGKETLSVKSKDLAQQKEKKRKRCDERQIGVLVKGSHSDF